MTDKFVARSAGNIKPLSTKANMLWNSAGSMLYLVCQWLVTVFVVRLSSGYDAAGLLSLAMSVVGIFGALANYKMGTYQISDIRREHTLGEYFTFRCFTLGASFVGCMVYSFITCPRNALVTVALFFVFKAVGLLIDVLHGIDQQNRRMDYIGKSFAAQGVSTLAVFVVVFATTKNLDMAILAMTVAALAVLVAFDLPKARQFERISFSLKRSKAIFFLKTSLPTVLASLAASALFTIPKQYLFWVSGDASLGIYSSVAAPALIIQMGAMYLYGPLLDIFPKYFFDGEKRRFLVLLVKTILGIVLMTIVCSIALEFMGAWVLQLLYGESIVAYVYLLQPIILSTSATAFLWFFGDLLITLRNFKAYFWGNGAAFMAVVPLSIVCVNTWGMNGVSFAGIAACLVGVFLLLFFLLREVRRGPKLFPSEGVEDKVT